MKNVQLNSSSWEEQDAQNKSDQHSFRSLGRIDHPLLADAGYTQDTKDKCSLSTTCNCLLLFCTEQSISLFLPLSNYFAFLFLAACLSNKTFSLIWLLLGWIILPVKWEFRAIRCTTPWRPANTTFRRQKNHRLFYLFYLCQLLLASKSPNGEFGGSWSFHNVYPPSLILAC